jgi:phage N-6-adenine-methyltransferase
MTHKEKAGPVATGTASKGSLRDPENSHAREIAQDLTTTDAQINEAYGSLKEGLHVTGYTFARVCTHLEWMLEDGRWKRAGSGFDDATKFLETIRLDQFRTTAEERKRLGKLLKDATEASNRQIARVLGVDEGTVRHDLRAENSAARSREAAPNGGSETASAENSAPDDQVARTYRTVGHGKNEWYTPAKYIEMARKVIGAIDLDPASSDKAQEIVRAERYTTAADDGLTQEWRGRVWLNPPYSQPADIYVWVSKLVTEVRAGRVSAAIMLTHNCTDTAWFHEAASVANAICFTRGRIKFIDEKGDECGMPPNGQTFFYFGDDACGFADVFAHIGLVAPLRWKAPAESTATEIPIAPDPMEFPEFLRRTS